MNEFVVAADQHDQRLDVVLVAHLGWPRAKIQKLIKAGAVTVNDKAPTVHQFLRTGEVVKIQTLTPNPSATPTGDAGVATQLSNALTIDVVAEYPDYIIVNKPAGLATHPANLHVADTMIQQLVARYPEIAAIGDHPARPGLVHRLDKDVSGLLVVARTAAMFAQLKQQFHDRTVLKRYIALVEGHLTPRQGQIDFPISRGVNGIMVARPTNQTGKPALTEYLVTDYISHYSLLAIRLHTGRTHQIRVHCKAMGHPVVGDTLYTVKKQKADRYPLHRLFLHAAMLGFTDQSGQWQEYAASLPVELTKYLQIINPNSHSRGGKMSPRRSVAVSGSPGSGKSTVTKRLAQELGYERISMGDIRRRLAEEKDMDLTAFNAWSETHPAGDVEVDALWKDIADRGQDGIIGEGRMAPHFLTGAIRFFLYLPPYEAARRMWASWDQAKSDRNEDASIKSSADLERSLIDRVASDRRRYIHYYGLDPFDPIHYDLWLDVSGLDQKAEFTAVWEFVQSQLTSH